MCGIAGYWNADGSAADRAVLSAMAQAMTLRGPDAEGFFTDGALGFAHRRLSVLDIAGGVQPMTTPDGGGTIVFNGEIFNHAELRAELESEGEVFETRSDTEVLLRLLQRKGASALEKLNGFCAAAFYDREKKTLLLIRDRFGVKPLYYRKTKESFAFASTLNALKELPGFDRNDISPDSIADYLSFQYVPGNRTFYSDIVSLPCGSWLLVDLNTFAIHTGKIPSERPAEHCNLSYPDALQRLRELVTDAVRRRLEADVPLGVFLSGGLDSAIVAGVAAKECGRALSCFSIGFADAAYDESVLAEETAGHLRHVTGNPLPHAVRTVDPCDLETLRFLAGQFGEPYADASMLPTYLLSRFTREDVTVALSGDGADELFGGYDRYRAMNILRFLNLPHGVANLLANLLPEGGERSVSGRLRRILSAAGLRGNRRYRFLMTHGADRITRESAKSFLAGLPDETELFYTPENVDSAWIWPEIDLHTYLPGDVLRKVDVCSMAASLEVRSPFLDFRAAAFAASLPADWKLHGKQRKKILSDAFRDLLPPGLAERKKRGFGVPVARWLRQEWNTPLREHLLSGGLGAYFETRALEDLIRRHESSREDLSYYLFSLLMLAFFLETNGRR